MTERNQKPNEETVQQGNEETKNNVTSEETDKEQYGGNKEIIELKKALAKAEEERDSFKDSYQRTFSEFNNYKKRNQTAASQAVTTGVCDAIEKILPVLDNFERALEHAEDQKDDAFATGVSMVYKQLADILAGMGVEELPALGEPFDPNLHQAIQQVEPEDGQESDTVVGVVQKGYTLGDRILRHSMVIVSK